MADQVRTDFRVGVRRVWVVLTSTRQVHDDASPSRVTILEWDDSITGGDVVPGFEAKVSAFFRRVLPNGRSPGTPSRHKEQAHGPG